MKSDRNSFRNADKISHEQEEIIDLVYIKDEDLKELEDGMESQYSNSEDMRVQLKRKDDRNLGENKNDSRKRDKYSRDHRHCSREK